MPHQPTAHSPSLVWGRRLSALAITTLLLTPAMSGADGHTVSTGTGRSSQSVVFRGYRLVVPEAWRVVYLRSHPHACLRFDHPAMYLGAPGDQSRCPARVTGGAPGLLVQPLDRRSQAAAAPRAVSTLRSGAVRLGRLPATGPVDVSVPGAGVRVTAVYGAASASLVQQVLTRGRLTASATPAVSTDVTSRAAAPRMLRRSAPGSFLGLGFDACTAPSQATMDAWRATSDYSSVGVYIGGVSRGCAQPNLTASWVSTQAGNGWHLIPTYVGLQAPCTRFYNRMSYNPDTAWAQGRAAAADAVASASLLGIGAPSTVYSDVEGYDNTSSSCVTAVLSYVSGWTRGLHERGYDSGVYSSASSGIRDLAMQFVSPVSTAVDDIWIAWWNSTPNANGGGYVSDALWSQHQRIHQYLGSVSERHGGFRLAVDRDYLDVSTTVVRPRGCPTRVDFRTYPVLRRGSQAESVPALQCTLAQRGFNPGAARGRIGWRTGAAIRAFKASRGLTDLTVVGRRAWTAALSGGPRPLLQTGSTGKAVERLQRSLTASLQRSVHQTATFGRNTRHAVREYQRARRLPVDGTANKQTWTALQDGR